MTGMTPGMSMPTVRLVNVQLSMRVSVRAAPVMPVSVRAAVPRKVTH